MMGWVSLSPRSRAVVSNPLLCAYFPPISLQSMLAVFPDNRISASEALGHPLFNVADADT